MFTARYELNLKTICRFLLAFKGLGYAKNVQKQAQDVHRDILK